MNRRSYRSLISSQSFGLFDGDSSLIATCRARNAEDARELFRRYVEKMPELAQGKKVKKLDYEGK